MVVRPPKRGTGTSNSAFSDLAVPPDLPGERRELAHHEPVALDDSERAGGRTRAQHPVLAIDDNGR